MRIVDLSHRGADHGIYAADLDEHGQHIQAGDIVLLRTSFMALPLKVDGGDGAPVRAVALEL